MISHQHKVIFIHIPKCAGRSISKAFNQEFDHHTATYYQMAYPDCWDRYTVFTTVRNPYQRLVSMYHYIKKEPVHAYHAITNFGNMLPFKSWVMANIAAFAGEFEPFSPEGNRETDGDMGSAFWFSSQVSRLSAATPFTHSNIHMLRYNDGMPAIQQFLHRETGIQLHIPHLNKSHGDNPHDYLCFYDQELLDALNSFPPFAKDCSLLKYEVIDQIPASDMERVS